MRVKITLLLALMVTSGCQSLIDKTVIVEVPVTVTASPTTTSVPMQVATETPLQEILPTLSGANAENKVLTLLHDNGGCLLPCFWGFRPGTTTISAFSKFLKMFGETPSIIEFQKGELSLGVDATAYGDYKGESDVVKWVDIFMMAYHKNEFENDKVYGDSNFSDYFQYYSLFNLLSEYGPPEEAYVVLDTGIESMGAGIDLYLLSIEYPKEGWIAVFEMPLMRKGTNLIGCPSEALIYLRVWSPWDKPADYFYGGFGGADKSYLYTIDEATGMTIEEFYQKFKDPANTACLETSSDIHK